MDAEQDASWRGSSVMHNMPVIESSLNPRMDLCEVLLPAFTAIVDAASTSISSQGKTKREGGTRKRFSGRLGRPLAPHDVNVVKESIEALKVLKKLSALAGEEDDLFELNSLSAENEKLENVPGSCPGLQNNKGSDIREDSADRPAETSVDGPQDIITRQAAENSAAALDEPRCGREAAGSVQDETLGATISTSTWYSNALSPREEVLGGRTNREEGLGGRRSRDEVLGAGLSAWEDKSVASSYDSCQTLFNASSDPDEACITQQHAQPKSALKWSTNGFVVPSADADSLLRPFFSACRGGGEGAASSSQEEQVSGASSFAGLALQCLQLLVSQGLLYGAAFPGSIVEQSLEAVFQCHSYYTRRWRQDKQGLELESDVCQAIVILCCSPVLQVHGTLLLRAFNALLSLQRHSLSFANRCLAKACAAQLLSLAALRAEADSHAIKSPPDSLGDKSPPGLNGEKSPPAFTGEKNPPGSYAVDPAGSAVPVALLPWSPFVPTEGTLSVVQQCVSQLMEEVALVSPSGIQGADDDGMSGTPASSSAPLAASADTIPPLEENLCLRTDEACLEETAPGKEMAGIQSVQNASGLASPKKLLIVKTSNGVQEHKGAEWEEGTESPLVSTTTLATDSPDMRQMLTPACGLFSAFSGPIEVTEESRDQFPIVMETDRQSRMLLETERQSRMLLETYMQSRVLLEKGSSSPSAGRSESKSSGSSGSTKLKQSTAKWMRSDSECSANTLISVGSTGRSHVDHPHHHHQQHPHQHQQQQQQQHKVQRRTLSGEHDGQEEVKGLSGIKGLSSSQDVRSSTMDLLPKGYAVGNLETLDRLFAGRLFQDQAEQVCNEETHSRADPHNLTARCSGAAPCSYEAAPFSLTASEASTARHSGAASSAAAAGGGAGAGGACEPGMCSCCSGGAAEDAVSLFQELCGIASAGIHQGRAFDDVSCAHALEHLLWLLDSSGPHLLKCRRMESIIRRQLSPALLPLWTLTNPAVFALCYSILLRMITLFRQPLLPVLRLLLPHMVVRPLVEPLRVQGRAVWMALHTLSCLSQQPCMLLELYTNLDCRIGCTSIIGRALAGMVVLATPNPRSSLAAMHADSLQKAAAEVLFSVLDGLRTWTTTGQRSSIHPNPLGVQSHSHHLNNEQTRRHSSAVAALSSDTVGSSMDSGGSQFPQDSGYSGGSGDSGGSGGSKLEGATSAVEMEQEGRALLDASGGRRTAREAHSHSGDAEVGGPHTSQSEESETPVGNQHDAFFLLLGLKQLFKDGVLAFGRGETALGLELLAVADLKASGCTRDHAAVLFRYSHCLDGGLVGELLGAKYSGPLLEKYLHCFDFTLMPIDEALRMLLCTFWLPGEAQKIDRIMEAFASRFWECNACRKCTGRTSESSKSSPNRKATPGKRGIHLRRQLSGSGSGSGSGVVCKCKSHQSNVAPFQGGASTAHILAFSIIMLHTDSHSQAVKVKMSKADFIRNNRGIDAGADLPVDLLSSLYDRVVSEEMQSGSTTASILSMRGNQSSLVQKGGPTKKHQGATRQQGSFGHFGATNSQGSIRHRGLRGPLGTTKHQVLTKEQLSSNALLNGKGSLPSTRKRMTRRLIMPSISSRVPSIAPASSSGSSSTTIGSSTTDASSNITTAGLPPRVSRRSRVYRRLQLLSGVKPRVLDYQPQSDTEQGSSQHGPGSAKEPGVGWEMRSGVGSEMRPGVGSEIRPGGGGVGQSGTTSLRSTGTGMSPAVSRSDSSQTGSSVTSAPAAPSEAQGNPASAPLWGDWSPLPFSFEGPSRSPALKEAESSAPLSTSGKVHTPPAKRSSLKAVTGASSRRVSSSTANAKTSGVSAMTSGLPPQHAAVVMDSACNQDDGVEMHASGVRRALPMQQPRMHWLGLEAERRRWELSLATGLCGDSYFREINAEVAEAFFSLLAPRVRSYLVSTFDASKPHPQTAQCPPNSNLDATSKAPSLIRNFSRSVSVNTSSVTSSFSSSNGRIALTGPHIATLHAALDLSQILCLPHFHQCFLLLLLTAKSSTLAHSGPQGLRGKLPKQPISKHVTTSPLPRKHLDFDVGDEGEALNRASSLSMTSSTKAGRSSSIFKPADTSAPSLPRLNLEV